MDIDYTSRLGFQEGARRLHVHETVITIQSEEDRTSHYQHSHAAEEAFYILEGEAIYEFEGREHHVKAGDLLFFPANSVHAKSRVLSDGMRYLVIRSVEPEDEPCCCGQDRPPNG